MHKLTKFEERVEKLSDDFQSTFTILPDGDLANMFHVNEQDEVARLVRKHLKVTDVHFIKTGALGDDPYDIWMIKFK